MASELYTRRHDNRLTASHGFRDDDSEVFRVAWQDEKVGTIESGPTSIAWNRT
jgi:hypothetical protein